MPPRSMTAWSGYDDQRGSVIISRNNMPLDRRRGCGCVHRRTLQCSTGPSRPCRRQHRRTQTATSCSVDTFGRSRSWALLCLNLFDWSVVCEFPRPERRGSRANAIVVIMVWLVRTAAETYGVDDGTAVLSCVYWKKFPDSYRSGVSAEVALGDCVNVLGKLRSRMPFYVDDVFCRYDRRPLF